MIATLMIVATHVAWVVLHDQGRRTKPKGDILVQHAKTYRARAEELRSAADGMKDLFSRLTAHRLADDYDVMADDATLRAAVYGAAEAAQETSTACAG